MEKTAGKGPVTLCLIDASGYVYRAYHAIRGLSTREGFPTNAVYGYANMLLKVVREQQPDYLAVVQDSKAPTFRHRLYPQYKAHRPPMPDELLRQLPWIDRLTRAFSLPVLSMEGFEADDLIATLVQRFAGRVERVVIVSGDKDLMQLVSDRVLMLDTMKDCWIGPGEVEERFGVPPGKVAEVQALMGDPGDNVPGVRGIGPKTAGKLISRFGGLFPLLERAEEVGGRAGAALREGREQALASLELVTLSREVPLEVELEGLRPGEPETEELRHIFQSLEFTRLTRQLAPRETLGREGYRLVTGEEELEALARELSRAPRFALDTETDSIDPMKARLVGLSFAWAPGQAAYLPLAHSYLGVPSQLPEARVRGVLGPLLADPARGKVGQNIKYDLLVLQRAGWEVRGVEGDSMVASWLDNPGKKTHNLEEIAGELLGHTMISYTDVTGKGRKQIPFSQVELSVARDYSCEDADVALRALELLEPRLAEKGLDSLYRELELPLIPVLTAMEREGVVLDPGPLAELGRELDSRLGELEEKIHREAGHPFNINSPRQLAQVLFSEMGLPALKKTKSGYSTNSDVLLELSSRHHLPAMVLDYRSLSKLKSTYVEALPRLVNPDTGRIHTSFNQTATATGRLSSSEPNLQNIPVRTAQGRRIREAFVAPEGCLLLSADYSQVELRILAHLSGDEELIAAFRDGEDVHARTARQVLGASERVEPELRRRAKAINFGIIYGMSAFGLSRELDIPPGEAASLIEGYFDTYSGVKRYLDRTLEEAREKGFVTTMLGRRRELPELHSSNPNTRQMGERMAVNTPIQGSAADIIKLAMLRVAAMLPHRHPGVRMVLQVHDELLFEVPRGGEEALAASVREAMSGVVELAVPLVVDVGTSRDWARAH